ncbi:MAG: hypothetical protein M0Z90_05945 [Desulfobacteraceae bacterium]|nr:hypothetical protein [Desulfobacteraceae bacterium]
MSLHKSMQGLVEYYMPDLRQRHYELKSACKRQLRRIKSHIIKLFALYLSTALCFMLVFGMVNYFWFTFRNTPVGSMFLAGNPPEALLSILTATNSNLVAMAFQLTIDTICTCLLFGLVCQFFGITRYFYIGRGWINRLFWYGICAALTSLDLFKTGKQFDFTTSVVLYLLPASCLSGDCLEFTSLLLPEIWIVFRLGTLRQFVKIARIRNNPGTIDHG